MLRLHQNPGGFPLIGFEGFGIIFTVLWFVKKDLFKKNMAFFSAHCERKLELHYLSYTKTSQTKCHKQSDTSFFNVLLDGVLSFALCVSIKNIYL